MSVGATILVLSRLELRTADRAPDCQRATDLRFELKASGVPSDCAKANSPTSDDKARRRFWRRSATGERILTGESDHVS